MVVARKIAEIRARVARVRELLPPSAADFVTGGTATEALILNLYLALQATSDLALHAVADRGLGVPGDARAAFQVLGTTGLVPPALVTRLSAAVGMRNRIAHQYGDMDLALVYAAARDGVEDLTTFAAEMARAYGL